MTEKGKYDNFIDWEKLEHDKELLGLLIYEILKKSYPEYYKTLEEHFINVAEGKSIRLPEPPEGQQELKKKLFDLSRITELRPYFIDPKTGNILITEQDLINIANESLDFALHEQNLDKPDDAPKRKPS